MLTLCIDTSYKYLSCALIEDRKLIAGYDTECFKRQSEEVFSAIDSLFKKTGKKPLDIDSVALAIGPGSYTGVRIGLTIAKVISTAQNIDLYTISTLRLYANNQKSTMVLLNARGERAYLGIYDGKEIVKADCIEEIRNIKTEGFEVIGDGSLVGQESKMPLISECFLNTFDSFEKVTDKDHLVPVYLKENEAYIK